MVSSRLTKSKSRTCQKGTTASRARPTEIQRVMMPTLLLRPFEKFAELRLAWTKLDPPLRPRRRILTPPQLKKGFPEPVMSGGVVRVEDDRPAVVFDRLAILTHTRESQSHVVVN